MKEPSIKKNYIFNAGYQMLALIVPLITTPYISRVLGATGIGIHSYSFSIVSYFTLFSALGTATYATRMLGIHRDDIEQRSKKFGEILILRTLLTTISIVVYLLYVFLGAAPLSTGRIIISLFLHFFHTKNSIICRIITIQSL